MITNELLTEFLQQELNWNSHTYCKSFEVFNRVIDMKISNNKLQTLFTGEVVTVERYNDWIKKRREKFINQLLDV